LSAPQRPPPPRDSKSNLYEAALAVVQARDAASQQVPLFKPAAGRGWMIGLLLLGLAGAIILLVRPGWLTGPDTLPVESPGVAAASLRLTLLRERQRVLTFSREHGYLPATLGEAGSTRDDIRYQATGSGHFVLSAQAGDSLIRLGSADSLSEFLGESLLRFKTRGKL
jgi:hypothetical protein